MHVINYTALMTTTLILHGHFYQPPRETPDTGIIPKQKSAYPSNDWNERITRECYAANAFSRYLTYDGRVENISNNYEYLSFNFGPTLLHWLKEQDPHTYNRIIEADRNSILRNNGHGNAIAQGFNHTILPLDSPQDARTQIIWGLEDFSYHFGRTAEGIWLPEAAINDTVIDLLIEQGVRFVILSPWQADSIETAPGSWESIGDSHAPYDHPFILEGTRGELAAFFYHPGLAQGISFDHYLRDADALYAQLLEIQERDKPSLLHSATDGEIFGHHEPFGDMCLAALIKKITSDQHFEISNYGAYLEQNAPTLRVRLRAGEDHRGTSWSCSHGVSRWYKDCGCSTGGKEGWNQEWRTPLRNAFILLSNELTDIYQKHIPELIQGKTPEEILLEYASVVSGREQPPSFAKRVLGPTSTPETESQLLRLLEGQRFRLYTFTSCGWFFSDLSGLEPTQNIRYAIQAALLYQDLTEMDLIGLLGKNLELAASNIEDIGNGKDIMISVFPALSRGLEAASYFVLNRLFALKESHKEHYGIFRLADIVSDGRTEFDLTIIDTTLSQRYSFHTSYIHDLQEGIVLHIHDKKNTSSAESRSVRICDLPERMIDEMYSWIDDSLARITDNDIDRITLDINNYTLLTQRSSCTLPNDSFYITNMGTCLRTLHSLFRQDLPFINREKLSLIENLLTFIQVKADAGIKQSISSSLTDYIDRHAGFLEKTFDREHSDYICILLHIARDKGLDIDITALQNRVYYHLDKVRKGLESASEELIEIGRQTGLVVEDVC